MELCSLFKMIFMKLKQVLIKKIKDYLLASFKGCLNCRSWLFKQRCQWSTYMIPHRHHFLCLCLEAKTLVPLLQVNMRSEWAESDFQCFGLSQFTQAWSKVTVKMLWFSNRLCTLHLPPSYLVLVCRHLNKCQMKICTIQNRLAIKTQVFICLNNHIIAVKHDWSKWL